MRYEVTVFGMLKGKKTRIWSIHLEAASPREAIAKAGVDLKAGRIVEVQEIEQSDPASACSNKRSERMRPDVSRIERNGVI